ncbi:hypothetical protein HDU98_010377 [Podochytrium sp. JEL0797]|nr:hypothetical protein HDU98_010377 [Podochytrium sp. JEL0797]
MDVSDVAQVLAFTFLRTENKWRILVGWAKAQQGMADLSLESGLVGGFNLDRAERDVKELAPSFVGPLFALPDTVLRKEVAVYSGMLGERIQTSLQAHLNTGSIRGFQRWATENNSRDGDNSQLNDRRYEFFVRCMQGIYASCRENKVEMMSLADLLEHVNGRLRGSEIFKIDELRFCMIRMKCEDSSLFLFEDCTETVLLI